MKESSKSAWDTDVTIQLAVSGQSKKNNCQLSKLPSLNETLLQMKMASIVSQHALLLF